MIDLLTNDWKTILDTEFKKPYIKDLHKFIDYEYSNFQCYPRKRSIFAALNHCSFSDVKVVIIGQDPYHKPHLANGLCFSVNSGMPIPASLQNIYKELITDLGIQMPAHGNLMNWTKQGVLLLNATLSVRVHKAGSHQKKGWEQLTDTIISEISQKKENVVFMLWGGYAKNKGAKIDKQKHLVLESGHPSPLSANRGFWFNNKHFSLCNEYLIKNQKNTIDWKI